MVVTVSGAIPNVQKVEETVRAWFGGLNGTPKTSFERVDHVTQDSPRVSVVTKPDAQQAHITLGLHTFARGSEDRFAMSLFNLIMGVSFTSRLFKEVREKRGLCYHIRSSSDNWADTGYWSIYAGVATKKVEETVKATLYEVGLAGEKGVTEGELNIAKKRLKTMLAFKSEDPEFMGEYYGRLELFGETVISLDDYTKRIDRVTTQDIARILKKYLIPRALNMAIVSNRKASDKFSDLLTF